MPDSPPDSASMTRVGPTSRDLEEALLRDVARMRQRMEEEPDVLSRGAWIAVPSATLRTHLQRRLAAHFGAVVGVSVRTLRQVASDLVGRRTPPPSVERATFDLLVRRAIPRHLPLAQHAERFDDGARWIASTLRDLLDAGLLPDGSADVRAQWLARLPEPAHDVAGSLIDVAIEVQRSLHAHDLSRSGDTWLDAARRLHTGHAACRLPAACFLYGVNDATGRLTELLRALARAIPTRIYVAQSRDPVWTRDVDVSAVWSERLLERLRAEAPRAPLRADLPAPPHCQRFTARGLDAECREVIGRLLERVDDGARFDACAIVTRTLAPYATTLRRVLREHGVPFTSPWSSPDAPEERRRRALGRVLRDRTRVSLDDWLDLTDDREMRGAVRAVTQSQGLRTLRELARAPDGIERELLRTTRLAADEAVESTRSAVRHAVRRAAERAARALEPLHSFANERTFAEHVESLRQLLHVACESGSPFAAAVGQQLDARDAALDPWAMNADEFATWFDGATSDVFASPLGDDGFGVQILEMGAARGLTFEHLFVIGMRRGAFPQEASEDALCPDAWRRPLHRMLPDLPLAAERRTEERALFVQLASSAPSLTLSYPVVDDDGNEAAASPWFDAFDRGPHPSPPAEAIGPHESSSRQQPAHRRLATLGTTAPRAEFEHAWGLTWPEVRDALDDAVRAGLPTATRWTRARLTALAQSDPDLATPAGRAIRHAPSPWFGWVGPASTVHVPAASDLEALARCPWRSFLERQLRLEPPRDPGHALPMVPARTLGNAVHRALELAIPSAGATSLDALPPSVAPLARPSRDTVEDAVQRASDEACRSERWPYRGFVRVVADRIRPLVGAALDADWPIPTSTREILGHEVRGEATLGESASPVRVRFRADRVDRVAGAVRLVDYKTGRSEPKTRKPDAVRRDVRQGTRLQTALYLRARETQVAEGSYVYVGVKDGVAEAHNVATHANDEETQRALLEAIVPLTRALDEGAFPPRLETLGGKKAGVEPTTCEYCEVRSACVRGDSGARARWRHVVEESDAHDDPAWQAWKGVLNLAHAECDAPPEPTS